LVACLAFNGNYSKLVRLKKLMLLHHLFWWIRQMVQMQLQLCLSSHWV